MWSAAGTQGRNYWKIEFTDYANPPEGEGIQVSRQWATNMLRDALECSVRRHLVSDVPVGVFLSGGIDSTAIVALASEEATEPLRTFSISFDDPAYNEGDVGRPDCGAFWNEAHGLATRCQDGQKGYSVSFLEKIGSAEYRWVQYLLRGEAGP